MSITNISKPTTTLANATRIPVGETWATIATTWATETNTWAEIGSLVNNSARIFGGQIWAFNNLPWQMTTPWIDAGGITNVNRPS